MKANWAEFSLDNMRYNKCSYRTCHCRQPGAVVWGLPGFANAFYLVLQIERAEDIFDQSGMKYLALADKRLRKACCPAGLSLGNMI